MNRFTQNICGFLVFLAILFTGIFQNNSVLAYGECDQYGFMASYDFISGNCKCMSGYVFGKGPLGDTQCVSGDSMCYDKYGYGSRFDSLSSSCECSYGYVFGKKYGRVQCISQDQACQDQLGYSARYNSLYNTCECGYGDVISGGTCINGNFVCHSKNGINSSYEDSSNSCKCDYGYTLNTSSQCVEKQNNVYFKLLDLDTDNRQAIIKSEYDYRKYLIAYGAGCYSYSFNRYKNRNLVVNLGTDYDLDTYDTIVLQDDDETCDITHRESTSEDSLEPAEETSTYYYIPPTPKPNFFILPTTTKTVTQQPPVVIPESFQVSPEDIEILSSKGVLKSSAAFRSCPSTKCSITRYYAETSEVSIIGKYKKGEWYRVNGTTDAGGTGNPAIGWIHTSLFDDSSLSTLQTNSETHSTEAASLTSQEKKPGILLELWKTFMSWFGQK